MWHVVTKQVRTYIENRLNDNAKRALTSESLVWARALTPSAKPAHFIFVALVPLLLGAVATSAVS